MDDYEYYKTNSYLHLYDGRTMPMAYSAILKIEVTGFS
jgi:hypothetical protein